MSSDEDDGLTDHETRQGSGEPVDDVRPAGSPARRRFLQATGAVGALGLAGCTGGNAPQGTTNATATTETQANGTDAQGQQTETGGKAVESEFTVQIGVTNPNINFNEFNFANYSWTLTNVLMDPLAQWNPKRDEWEPLLAKDWTIQDGKLEMEIQQGYHWHNTGEPVTAKDAAKSFWLELMMEWSVSEYATDVYAKDERTVIFELKNQLNRQVLEHELLGGTWVTKPPHIFGKWIEQFEAAKSKSERDKIRKKLSKWTYGEPFGYGPVKVANMNSQRMMLEPFEGHPEGEAMNFDTYAFEYIGGGNNKVWQAMRANTVDAVPSVFAPKQVVQGLPDNWTMTLHPSYSGTGIAFDHKHPDLKKRPVRQAIAYVVNRETAARNAGGITMEPLEYPDGLVPQVSQNWFGDWQSTLNAYEYSPKKAMKLMQQAGYTKQGRYWRGPNGKLQLKFVAPAGWTDWVTAAKTMSSQLRAFGIDAQLTTMESGTYTSEILPNEQWDLAMFGWGGGPYPLFSFQQMFEKKDMENLNYDPTVTVPKWNGSGTTTVETQKLLQSINQNAKNDKQGFKKLAWVWNQDLPILPVMASKNQSFITTDDWKIPSKDAEVMAYDPPSTFLPKFGELRAETK